MRSLLFHSKASEGLREDTPDTRTYKIIMTILQDWFKAAEWSIPSDFLTFEHYSRVLNKLDWTSSPGYPYMRKAPTNGILFKVVDGKPSTDRVHHFWDIVQCVIQERSSDPIRMFIKPEPLKAKKVESKQYRLISSVSVVDQIIDHMLFGDFNQKIIENFMDLPTKVGWAPYNGGYRIIPPRKWMAIDKSKWDWTVKIWQLSMELELREALCQNPTSEWKELALWRYKELFVKPEYICSNGVMFRQKQPGVMKSGCVNTITTNSILQVLLHVRVCLETNQDITDIMSMGDDTLQAPVADEAAYVAKLAEYCLVKHHIHDNEFAGNLFQPDNVEPLYRGKHAYTLLHCNPSYVNEIAQSYALLYHRSIHKQKIRELFQDTGIELPSEDKCDLIWESEG